MKGKQINFYLLNSEIQEIDNYLLNQEISILGIPMPSTKLNFLNSILEPSPSFMKFLTLKKWGNRIKTRYIEEQNYYLIDIFNSPVIEFSLPFQKEKNILRKGRIYFLKESGDEEFNKFGESFLKWFRKSFKNSKLPGYEDLLVTNKVRDWLNSSQDYKLDCFPEVSIKSKEKLRVA